MSMMTGRLPGDDYCEREPIPETPAHVTERARKQRDAVRLAVSTAAHCETERQLRFHAADCWDRDAGIQAAFPDRRMRFVDTVLCYWIAERRDRPTMTRLQAEEHFNAELRAKRLQSACRHG